MNIKTVVGWLIATFLVSGVLGHLAWGNIFVGFFVWLVYFILGYLLSWAIEWMTGKHKEEDEYQLSREDGTLVFLLWPFAALFAFIYVPLELGARLLFKKGAPPKSEP